MIREMRTNFNRHYFLLVFSCIISKSSVYNSWIIHVPRSLNPTCTICSKDGCTLNINLIFQSINYFFIYLFTSLILTTKCYVDFIHPWYSLLFTTQHLQLNLTRQFLPEVHLHYNFDSGLVLPRSLRFRFIL